MIDVVIVVLVACRCRYCCCCCFSQVYVLEHPVRAQDAYLFVRASLHPGMSGRSRKAVSKEALSNHVGSDDELEGLRCPCVVSK